MALAHERGCEAELALLLERYLDAGGMPGMAILCDHFAPHLTSLPDIVVLLAPLSDYNVPMTTPFPGIGGMTRAALGASISGDALGTHSIDVGRLSIVLNVLHLPAINYI